MGYLVYYVYHHNIIPQFTSLINLGFGYLQGGFNANPFGIVAAAGGAITGVTTAAKLMWDRTKSGLNSVINEKDGQLISMSDEYATIKTEVATVRGQLTTAQTELQATKTTLTTTQTELTNALTQIQQKQNEINAVTNVKAAELKMANSVVTIDSVLKELDPTVDAGAAQRILTGKGITVTVP